MTAVRYGLIWCQYWDYAAGQPGGWCHDLGTFYNLRDAYLAYDSAVIIAVGLVGLPVGTRVLMDEQGNLLCPPDADRPALSPYLLEDDECDLMHPDD